MARSYIPSFYVRFYVGNHSYSSPHSKLVYWCTFFDISATRWVRMRWFPTWANVVGIGIGANKHASRLDQFACENRYAPELFAFAHD